MATLTLRLEDDLHRDLKLVARLTGVSMNQVVCTATRSHVEAVLRSIDVKERLRRLHAAERSRLGPDEH